MTLKAKINGEWLKVPLYAVLDAIHTTFTSTKYTATNVSAALDEVADRTTSLETALLGVDTALDELDESLGIGGGENG